LSEASLVGAGFALGAAGEGGLAEALEGGAADGD
jgi:hypothetical protein